MGKGTLIKAEEIAAMIVARWAGQALVLWGFVFLGPEARGACVSRHAKTDPPQSIIFISISQQDAKIHSCSPVFPPFPVEDIEQQGEWLGRPWFMNDKEDKRAREEENQAGFNRADILISL